MLPKRDSIATFVLIAVIIAIFALLKLFIVTCEGNITQNTCGINVVNPYEDLIGIQADDYQYFGFMHLTHENLRNGKLPFAANNIFRYPGGFNYEYGFDGAFPVLLGALLGFIVDLVFAYNFVIFIVLFLNVFISYVFFKKIAELKDVEYPVYKALVVALIYGASPYVLARLNSHINLAVIFGFPILIYSFIRWINEFKSGLTKFSKQSLAYFYLGIFATMGGSIQFLISILLLIVIYFGLVIYRYKTEFIKWFIESVLSSKLFVLISTILFLGIFLFFFHGYVQGALTGSLNTRYIGAKVLHADFSNFVVPNAFIGKWYSAINPSLPSMESVITIGFIPLIIFLYTIFTNLKGKSTREYFLMLLIIGLLMFGFVKVPFMPQAGRLIVLFSLVISLFILTNLRIAKKSVLVVIIVLLLVGKFAYASYYNKIRLPYFEVVEKLNGEAVLSVPLNQYEPKRSIQPYFYKKKILDGYFHFPAINVRSVHNFAHPFTSRFDCNELRDGEVIEDYKSDDINKLVEYAKENKIQYLVLNKKDGIGNYYSDGCSNVARFMSHLNNQKLIIDESTNGVTKKDFVFTKNENGKVEVQFESYGKMYINGFTVYPNEIQSININVDGFVKRISDWNSSGEARNANLVDPIEINVDPGTEITISVFPNDSDLIRYVTIYYAFDGVPAVSDEKVQLEETYDDEDVTIYKIY